MQKTLILLAILPLAACGVGGPDRTPITEEELQSRKSIYNISFGNDDGDWSNDNECDDPRFRGPGMTIAPVLEEDTKRDATDCRNAYERGDLVLIG